MNTFHEDPGFEGPLKGREVQRAVKGIGVLQAGQDEERGEVHAERTYLPAAEVAAVLDYALGLIRSDAPRCEMLQLVRLCAFTVTCFCTIGRTDTGRALRFGDIGLRAGAITFLLRKEKGKAAQRVKRRLVFPAGAVDGFEELLRGWRDMLV